jgi:hypothetical protein
MTRSARLVDPDRVNPQDGNGWNDVIDAIEIDLFEGTSRYRSRSSQKPHTKLSSALKTPAISVMLCLVWQLP